MRFVIARALITLGVFILPKDIRELTRNLLMYHVPNALTDAEKREVELFAAHWRSKQ